MEGEPDGSSTFAVDGKIVPLLRHLVCEEYKHSAYVQYLLLLLRLVNYTIALRMW